MQWLVHLKHNTTKTNMYAQCNKKTWNRCYRWYCQCAPPFLSEMSPNIVWRGAFWNRVWRQGERELRAVTEKGNRRQGERELRAVIEQGNKNSRFVTEQGNSRIPGLWQNWKTEEFQVCDRTGKQKNSRFVQQRKYRPVWPPTTSKRPHHHIFSTNKRNSLNAVENLPASLFPEQM